MPRAEIGELTDWHVWQLYIRPAVHSARKSGRRDGGRRRNRKASRLPTREEYIATGAHLGGDPEALGSEYDTWAASEEGQRLCTRTKTSKTG
ncbi:hypothetical protein VT84_09380 [Gemmata sp. SH-PL17]|uniref:hypothetical protein n=1 Tax=Gemmata sp. SH-PL17 TaxID=1630693 RepID=UPI00078C3761|nr:hypothetical protein [Gemmata sp. SH-PL17]AMV24595.1 hypothetical protein VT84_09380 [Gemmata sp. SH-PL17]